MGMDSRPMAPARNLVQDGRVLWHLIFSPVRGASHEERLESFYSRQAESYDGFRKRLLHGRRELIESLDAPPGGVWVDLGAGTGDNLQWFEDRVGEFSEIHLVDLSESLLGVAQRHINGDPRYARARVHHADATRFEVPEGSVDLVTFSYSLTMIPDWFAAIDRAWSILKPGGRIGVVDFFVSRKHPLPGDAHHRWLERLFWSTWFAADNVVLSPDHLATLRWRFETERTTQRKGSVPYLPFVKAPYYLWIGCKPA